MAQRPMPRWERTLRRIGSNLVESIGEIFGSGRPVSWRPPDPGRGEETGLAHDGHTHTPHLHPDKADRLPPRERRGRD